MFIYIEHKQDVNTKITIIKDELERLCIGDTKTQTNQFHKTGITKHHGKLKTSEITSDEGG